MDFIEKFTLNFQEFRYPRNPVRSKINYLFRESQV